MSSSATFGQRARRLAAVAFVGLLPLLCGGWLSGPQSTFDTKGPVAESQLQVFYVTLWVTLVIFVIVAGVLAYATLKFTARSTDDEHAAPPPQGHGNPLVEMSLIVASILALVVIAVPTLRAIWFTYDVPEAERDNAYEITATGYQWWFKFSYPSETAQQKIGPGAVTEVPFATANELVIPAGRPVHIELRTQDVIHSFWVPKLAGKVDMMPNRGNHLWLKADEPGYFWGQCAEYCGESHAVMRFRVIALAEDDFNEWLAQQKTLARNVTAPADAALPASYPDYGDFKVNEPGWSDDFDQAPFDRWQAQQEINADENPALIARGRELFKTNLCVTCHSVRGHDALGVIAPDLTHVGARTTIAGGLLENTPKNLYRWITEPNHVKPGNLMWRPRAVPSPTSPSMDGYLRWDSAAGDWVRNIEVTDDEAHALVAYLHSLK